MQENLRVCLGSVDSEDFILEGGVENSVGRSNVECLMDDVSINVFGCSGIGWWKGDWVCM